MVLSIQEKEFLVERSYAVGQSGGASVKVVCELHEDEFHTDLPSKTTQAIRNAKLRYFHNILKVGAEPSKLWINLRTIGLGNPRTQVDSVPVSLDELNDHFAAVQSITLDEVDKEQTVHELQMTPIPNREIFFFTYVTETEDQVYRRPVRDLADLQERLYAAVNNVTPQMLHNTWLEIEYRLDISRATNGSHVKVYGTQALVVNRRKLSTSLTLQVERHCPQEMLRKEIQSKKVKMHRSVQHKILVGAKELVDQNTGDLNNEERTNNNESSNYRQEIERVKINIEGHSEKIELLRQDIEKMKRKIKQYEISQRKRTLLFFGVEEKRDVNSQ
ncbi:hypothetical protein ANN_10677 [Periplaneta americana]|uniref:Uncharacterized protein n=1 Tax=Periplaneta americana TaxID=6978 RepID=A0ABQ8T2X8_PERAM|nr:hypothetical protein ANN_10677 [Periplaneta americana]